MRFLAVLRETLRTHKPSWLDDQQGTLATTVMAAINSKHSVARDQGIKTLAVATQYPVRQQSFGLALLIKHE